MSSSSVAGVASPRLSAASPKADPKALPNMFDPGVPDGLSLVSFSNESALKDDSSLNGVVPKTLVDFSSCPEEGAGVLGVTKELWPNLLPLPNPPALLVFAPRAEKPP